MPSVIRRILLAASLAVLPAGAVPALAVQHDHGLSPEEERALDSAAEALEAADAALQAVGEAADSAEAEGFMARYAELLRAGDRAAIAALYHRDGAWRVGHGEKRMESRADIEAYYASPSWSPPARFEWRDLSYEWLSEDAVVVVGLFDWESGGGRPPVTYSYTGLLVRQDGELRIRLEDESGPRNR